MNDLKNIKTYSPEYTNGEFGLGFENGSTVQQQRNDLHGTSEARAVAEVQAQYVIAKKFPRNQHESYRQIMETCRRPFLA